MNSLTVKSKLPADWQVVKLGDRNIFEVKLGGTPKSSVENYWGGEISWITPNDLSALDSAFVNATERTITKEGLRAGSTLLPEGSVILSTRAPIGYVGVLKRAMAFNQGCKGIVIQNIEKANNLFVYYFLRTQKYILHELGSGSTFRELSTHDLNDLFIPLPPLPEQQKIVYVLDTIQEAIEVQDKIIDLTKELKKSVMVDLFKYGAPSFRKGRKLKKTEVGEIPESWRVTEIGQILDYEQPSQYIVKDKILDESTENSVPVLTANKAVVLGYTNETEGRYTEVPVIIFDDFTTDKKFVDFPFKVKSSAMKILKLKDRRMDLKIIFEILSRIQFSHSGEHKRYYLSEYQKIKIPLPPLEEQKAIAEILQTIDQKIEIEKKKKALYEELFRAMLNKLMTAEIRVKDVEFK